MVTISLCMIVKNEEDVLTRCLESASGIADEIIIVDTGSTDRTKEIAHQFTDKVYDFEWIDDFSAARNFSFEQATSQYCMWLDADDVILEADQQKLLKLKQTMSSSVDIVMLKYNIAFDAQGHPTFSYFRERIIRNHSSFRWQGFIHEAITPAGNILKKEIAIIHKKLGAGDPNRNLRIFESRIEAGTILNPREQYYYARELYYHKRYTDAIAAFEQFLTEEGAWIENKIEACSMLYQCYRAIEQPEAALNALFRSFLYDMPRAELACDAGAYFLETGRLKQAIYWYQTALLSQRDLEGGGFVQPDCYDYIPYLQLCVCYDRLGDHELAAKYNEKAGSVKPDSASYLSNRDYFERIGYGSQKKD